MNLDHAFAYVAGGICAAALGYYALAEAAAWNRRRAARARTNKARRDASRDRHRHRIIVGGKDVTS